MASMTIQDIPLWKLVSYLSKFWRIYR